MCVRVCICDSLIIDAFLGLLSIIKFIFNAHDNKCTIDNNKDVLQQLLFLLLFFLLVSSKKTVIEKERTSKRDNICQRFDGIFLYLCVCVCIIVS